MPDLVEAIGSAAGFAAIAGLAVLAAAYVSHAREVQRLRAWAGDAVEQSRRDMARSSLATRYAAVAVVGLLVFSGAAYGATQLIGADGAQPHKRTKRRRHTIVRGNVTVAVLNGTTVPGLAATLRDRLGAAGFKEGVIDVFPDQQLATSVVQYAPGHEVAAKAVGRLVGIDQREPITADSRARAGDATVIVVAGADKAP